jgi:hypothetical protein
LPTRRQYLLQDPKASDETEEDDHDAADKAETGSEEVQSYAPDRASAHAVYRLADMLDLPRVKAEAREAIIEDYTVENVRPLLSSPSLRHLLILHLPTDPL